MERFIANTNKRYVITSEGEVFSLYRFDNQQRKREQRRKVKPYKPNQGEASPKVLLILDEGKRKSVCISVLIIEAFKLSPPDEFHYYDLKTKDDDFWNMSLNNLVWKIRMYEATDYSFYPQPIYNKKGEITEKICAVCGEKRPINLFQLQQLKNKTKRQTYRNCCEKCRSSLRWEKIKNDPELLEIKNIQTKNFYESEEGQTYYKDYRKKQNEKDREAISDRWISNSLRMMKSDLTPEIIEVSRKRIILKRKLNLIKTKNYGKENSKDNKCCRSN